MAATSEIEWTDATWNPVRGCTKISPGCAHCYAETFAERFRGVAGHPYEQGFDPRLVPDKLTDPLRWKKPRMVFVNSMSDLFHVDVPDDYIDQVFAVMALAHWHTFQVLTKRSARMLDYMRTPDRKRTIAESVMYISNRLAVEAGSCKARIKLDDFSAAFKGDGNFPNVWLGVSVENRKHGLPRIAHLRQTPAAVRFLSVEPLLEDLGRIGLDGVGWCIVGGESGHGARPMNPDWVRSIRDHCVSAGVPFFFKQWGEWVHVRRADDDSCLIDINGNRHSFDEVPDNIIGAGKPVGRWWQVSEPGHWSMYHRVGKAKAGRMLDGRLWDEYPKAQVPA